MPEKLIYTSASRLLQAGRSGFGTVAMTRNIPAQLAKSVERCSQFSRQRGLPTERVIFAYRTEKTTEGLWHVFSCARDAGADYSGRTNHEVQHLIFSEREASACASEQITPAGIMAMTHWHRHDGFCGYIDGSPDYGKYKAEETWPYWSSLSTSRNSNCRLNLSSDAALRGSVFVYGNGLEQQNEENAKLVLCLYAESQTECPNFGWGITFTTFLEPGDELSDFRWIGVPENSPMLERLRSAGGRQWISLNDPAPAKVIVPSKPSPLVSPVRQNAANEVQTKGPSAGSIVGTSTSGTSQQKPPTRPKPVQGRGGFGDFLSNNGKSLAVMLGIFILVLGSWVLLFPSPPQIEFVASQFAPYEGKIVQLEVRTVPPGREHEVKIEPQVLRRAGETQVTASIAGRMFGASSSVTRVLRVPHGEATIEFDTNSLVQSWQDGGDGKVKFTVKPEFDPENPEEPLSNFVKLFFRPKGESEWSDTFDRSRNATYEVMALLDHSDCNYKGQAATNLTVSVLNRSDDKKEAQSAGTPNQGPLNPTTTTTQPAVRYFLVAGSDPLKQAALAGILKSNPSRVSVHNWTQGAAPKEIKKDGMIEGKESWSYEPIFKMKDGWPVEVIGTDTIVGDTSIYTAEYEESGETVVLVGLGSDAGQSVEKAVAPYVSGLVWVFSNDQGNTLEVASNSDFLKAMTFVPQETQFILGLSTPELKEVALPPAKTLKFDGSELLRGLEKERDSLEVNMKPPPNAPKETSPEQIYFQSNIETLVEPLRRIPDKEGMPLLAEGVIEEIKKITPPAGSQDKPSSEFDVSSALFIGALNIVCRHPSIGQRLALSKSEKDKLSREQDSGKKAQAGMNLVAVKSYELLEPNDLREWMLLNSPNKQPGAKDVVSYVYKWLEQRIGKLQKPSGTSALHDPEEGVLKALRQGVLSCSNSPQIAFAANAAPDPAAKKKELDGVAAKIDSLKSVGTPSAKGSAHLQVRFPDGRSFILLPNISLAPPLQANK
jgi:hypothetical protein